MAKKFGKFLLFTAAVGTAAAAAYYYMQQKDSQLKESSDADDDYDDFHEDLDKSRAGKLPARRGHCVKIQESVSAYCWLSYSLR